MVGEILKIKCDVKGKGFICKIEHSFSKNESYYSIGFLNEDGSEIDENTVDKELNNRIIKANEIISTHIQNISLEYQK